MIILSCAGMAAGQYSSGYTSMPAGQYPYGQSSLPAYGQNSYSIPAQSNAQQYLPADYPPTISVPGLDMTGLVQGDNNISYAIKVISQDENSIYFQVKAFCVYNTQSQYAILHILSKPLMGVIDQQKNTMQIDFSQLTDNIDSIRVIQVSDVDQVLMQSNDVVVLNTVMAMDSSDGSTVRFSISDMSLLEPNGVLNDLALPGPVQGIYDVGDSRFSTVAYPEMANLFQQNFIAVQQNTFINVVNQVNVVNVINVVDIGGFGCGYGYPYGGYGGYGGYGYGGGFVPCVDPLPLPYADEYIGSPLRVPERVHVYGDVPKGHRKLDRHVEDPVVRSPDIVQDYATPDILPAVKNDPVTRTTTPKAVAKPDNTRLTSTSTPKLTSTAPSKTVSSGKQLADQASLSASKHKEDTQNTAQQLSGAKTKSIATPVATKQVAAKPKAVTNSGPKSSDPVTKVTKAPDTTKTTKQTAKPSGATTKTTPASKKSVPQTNTVKSSPQHSTVKPVQTSTQHTVSAPVTKSNAGHSASKAPSAPTRPSGKNK